MHSREVLSHWVGLVVILVMGSLPLLGQENQDREWSYRGQAMGGVGYSALYHGDSNQFSGASLLAKIGVRPLEDRLKGLGFAGRVVSLFSDSDEWQSVTVFSGLAEYHFSSSRVQPYLSGGLALVRADRNVGIQYGDSGGTSAEELFREKISKIGLEVGGGVKVALAEHFIIEPAVHLVDTTAGSGINLGIPKVSVCFGVSW